MSSNSVSFTNFTRHFNLISAFKPAGDQVQAIAGLLDGVKRGFMHQTLLGVTGSGKTFTMANVVAALGRPALILAPNKTLAAQLYTEMREFFPKNRVEYFVSYYDYYQPEAYVPASDTYIAKDAAVNDQIERMRLSATKAIMERRDCIIVASVSAIYGLGDPEMYLSMVLHVDKGDIIDQRQLLQRLAELQYERNDLEFQRASFRVRGDIIDIFLAEEENIGIRLSLFGDEIEDISVFDPLTGNILQKLTRITIYPKTHYATPREQILKAIDNIKEELKQRLLEFEQNKKLLEAQRLRERTELDLEMLVELGYCSGIENYSRYLSNRKAGEPPPTLIDYLPKDALLIIDESHVTIPQLNGMYKGDRSRKENLVNYGFRLPSALDNRPLRFDEFKRLQPQTVYVSATPGEYEINLSEQIVEQVVRPTGLLDPIIEVRPQGSQVDDLLSEINLRAANNERILVTCLTKKMAEDLTHYLEEHEVKVRYLHSDIDTVERVEIIRDLRLGVFSTLVGINLLREGLDIPEVALVAILDADKEGFLRSGRSLIQTIGRAARNINGKVLLYADKMTDAMRYAIDETNRRRCKQDEFNKKHNITPQGIKKKIVNIISKDEDNIKEIKEKAKKTKITGKLSKIQQDLKTSESWDSSKIIKKIAELEAQMHKFAHKLQFEEAAFLRDEITRLRERFVDNS